MEAEIKITDGAKDSISAKRRLWLEELSAKLPGQVASVVSMTYHKGSCRIEKGFTSELTSGSVELETRATTSTLKDTREVFQKISEDFMDADWLRPGSFDFRIASYPNIKLNKDGQIEEVEEVPDFHITLKLKFSLTSTP